MAAHRSADHRRRLVSPPDPNDPSVPNRVTAVLVRPNQRVRWFWSVTPDHRHYVSGYELVQTWRVREPTPPEGRRRRRPPFFGM